MRRILGIAMALAVLAGACGDDDVTVTGDEAPDSASVHDEWKLVDGPVPDAAFGATTLRIDVDGTANGSTACNGYSTGGPAIEGDRWVAAGFVVTEMGCEPDRMEAESGYLAVLATMARVSVSTTNLELSTTDGSSVLLFQRVVPSPDAALVGTTWVLESLIRGDAVSSTMEGAEDATLVLGTDGSVTGTDGCGSFSGSYEIDGDRIRWSVEVEVGTSCNERFVEQSSHIENALATDTTYLIEGPRLVLIAADGTGLDYRARA